MIKATDIWIIRIDRIESNLQRRQVEAWRVATESQHDAFTIGKQLWTEWLRQHPDIPSSLVISAASGLERGIA